MLGYALQRLVVLVVTLAVASFVVFGVIEILPGDAAQTMLGASATPETVAALAHKLGLDQPFAARYWSWATGALRGDLGLSYAYNSPIAPLIAERLAVSAPLALLAMAIATLVALVAGVYAADRRGRAGDAAVMAASQVGLAVPNFWFAILLVLTVRGPLAHRPGRRLSRLGRRRRTGAGGADPAGDRARPGAGGDPHPRRALGADRGAGEDFIRTARAKGLSRRAALWRHALPNAMTPILTVMGLQFANLIASAIVVENVFVLPGLGRLIVQSIANRDALVVEDCVMLLVAFVIAVNFLVDLACAAIDPRLRAHAT